VPAPLGRGDQPSACDDRRREWFWYRGVFRLQTPDDPMSDIGFHGLALFYNGRCHGV
jgi:hypothetical protein